MDNDDASDSVWSGGASRLAERSRRIAFNTDGQLVLTVTDAPPIDSQAEPSDDNGTEIKPQPLLHAIPSCVDERVASPTVGNIKVEPTDTYEQLDDGTATKRARLDDQTTDSPQPRLTLLGCSALPLAAALSIQPRLAVVGADDIAREQTGIEDGEIDEQTTIETAPTTSRLTAPVVSGECSSSSAVPQLEQRIVEQQSQLADAGERVAELNARIAQLEDSLRDKTDECARLERRAKHKKRKTQRREQESAAAQEDLKEKLDEAMHELERKIEEIEKLQTELEKKESHEKEFEIQQRDVLAVRLKMQELQRTIGQQEETIQGYSELLKQIGFTTTQTGTAGFRVNF